MGSAPFDACPRCDRENCVCPGDYEDDYDPVPTFGCACENPLSVDTVCESCIAYLKDQEAEAARGEQSRTSPDGSVTVTVPCNETGGELP